MKNHLIISNSDISKVFNETADLLKLRNANPFRINAFLTASSQIKNLPYEIQKYINVNGDFPKVQGIGKSLRPKIFEICKKGDFKYHQDLVSKTPDILLKLLKINSIGPVRAVSIYKQTNAKNIRELLKKLNNKELKLRGIGEKTIDLLKKEIKRKESKTYLRDEIEKEGSLIIEFMRQHITRVKFILAGSFRRGKASIGDLDIMAIADAPMKVKEVFHSYPRIERIVQEGFKKSRVRLMNGIFVDLRVFQKEQLGSGLLYMTGSKLHNIKLRNKAKKMGFKLNEYGLFQNKKIVSSKSEQEIYKRLNIQFIEPELREGTIEIERAEYGQIPSLINREDLKGDFHIHTKYSDGRNTIEEMRSRGLQLKYEYLSISDHTQKIKIAHGLSLHRQELQLAHIDRLNDDLLMPWIIKSAEIEILENGQLDISEHIMNQLDMVIVSIHSHFGLSRKKQTDRIIRAIQTRHVNILAHPTCRIINKRKEIDADWDCIFQQAKSMGVVLEINGQPSRMDLNDILSKKAKDQGLFFSLTSDAHSIAELELIKNAVTSSKRSWIEKKQVINTLNISQLKKLLKEKK